MLLVMPAKAGIQSNVRVMPAQAGIQSNVRVMPAKAGIQSNVRVMPAKAGIQTNVPERSPPIDEPNVVARPWIPAPACAGAGSTQQ